jgi:hypothetical protein
VQESQQRVGGAEQTDSRLRSLTMVNTQNTMGENKYTIVPNNSNKHWSKKTLFNLMLGSTLEDLMTPPSNSVCPNHPPAGAEWFACFHGSRLSSIFV